jgi:hypothetical protein
VVILGAAMREDDKGCMLLSFDRRALDAGIKPAIRRSLAKPEFY